MSTYWCIILGDLVSELWGLTCVGNPSSKNRWALAAGQAPNINVGYDVEKGSISRTPPPQKKILRQERFSLLRKIRVTKGMLFSGRVNPDPPFANIRWDW